MPYARVYYFPAARIFPHAGQFLSACILLCAGQSPGARKFPRPGQLPRAIISPRAGQFLGARALQRTGEHSTEATQNYYNISPN